MPIGDPMGGELYDLGRGRLIGLWMASVPVKDLDEAVEYYRDTLGLDIVLDARDRNWVEMGWRGSAGLIVLYVPKAGDARQPGGDTGIVFATESAFELHRRLVDEGVTFLLKPERQAWGGLMVIFEDIYGNRFSVVEDANAKVPASVSNKERPEQPSGVTIRHIITK